MVRNEFIVIPRFNSVEEGIDYLTTNNISFSFGVDDKFFSILGDEIFIPEGSIIFGIDDAKDLKYIELHVDPLPGQLYVDNGLLKYYKESYEI
jgi:hypothetical protein